MRQALLALLLVAWSATARAELHEVRLSTGPHAPGDAPDLVVHVPAGFDATKPLEVVVFLHGFDGCARALVSDVAVPCQRGEPPHAPYRLASLHERARTNTLLFVPQLAFHARTTQGHRFLTRGSFDAMLHEGLVSVLSSATKVRSVTLVAHSGGYGAVVPILRDESRKTPIDNVVMLDAMYAGWDVLAHWALGSDARRLVSLHTAQKATQLGDAELAKQVIKRAPRTEIATTLTQAVRDAPVLIARVRTAHGAMPEAHLAEVLAGLPLAARKAP